MATEQTQLILPVAAGDTAAVVCKPWPFTQRPIAGELVSIRILGWEGPQRVPIERVWWEPGEVLIAEGVTRILLPQQRALAENPTRQQVYDFYRQYGWVPYTGSPL